MHKQKRFIPVALFLVYAATFRTKQLGHAIPSSSARSKGLLRMSQEPLPDLEGRPNCQVVTEKIPNLLGSKALGVDWGARRIGVGVTAGYSQSAVTVIPNKARTSPNVTDHHPELDAILRLAKVQAVARIVIGMPYYR